MKIKSKKNIIIGVIFLLFIIILFFLFLNTRKETDDDVDNKVYNFEESESSEIVDDVRTDINETDLVENDAVFYGDTRINIYDNCLDSYKVAQYFMWNWKNIGVYSPEDFDEIEIVLDIRTDSIYAIHDMLNNYLIYVEVEQIDDNNFYVKCSNSENSDFSFYQVSITKNGIYPVLEKNYCHYDINIQTVSYEEIKQDVSIFTDQPTLLTNNRSYAEYYLNELKEHALTVTNGKQSDVYIDGDDENPATIDSIMDYLSLKNNKR